MTPPTPDPRLWLFPATYLLHIAEEYWGGAGFHRWIGKVIGRQLSSGRFLAVNAALWAAMLAAVAVPGMAASNLVLAALAIIVFANGLGHLAGSILTRSYSPGLVTGVALWAPLGAFYLLRLHPVLPAGTFWGGIALGLGVQGGVAMLALGLSKRL